MSRLLSVLAGLLLGTALSAAGEKTLDGDIYATVDVLTDGTIDVVDVKSDLPEDMNPRIEEWLQRQAIELAAAADTEPPNRTTVHIGYTVIEGANGGRGLAMVIKGTGVGVPAGIRTVSQQDADIGVRVRILADGSVADVMPINALPPGVEERDIVNAVREDIENDEEIQRAAREGRLREGVYTLTVRPRPARD